ncbi:MAG TPA: hypothetical protein VNK95_24580 [Caldilineaceae bacterium]|nr:hypothetical protein [Caldilineaceae bacterium]
MPPITRLFVKAALAYFVAALLLGLLLAAHAWLPLPAWIPALNPLYFHLFMVGWVTELIAGIAYWMFPKFSREQPRGSDSLAWATFVFLNLGLLLRVAAEPANVYSPGGVWGSLLAASALLQWLGGVSFVANTWPRVKEK